MSGEPDTYKTLWKPSQGLYKDRGSKFIALAWPVENQNDIKKRLEETKQQYHDAHHHCFAWALGRRGELHRHNDDGEPAGSAGKPIYGQILSYGLTRVLIIVVRYFGGTKLGVRGLINAYRGAAKDAIDNNRIIAKTIVENYRLDFDYPVMDRVMRILKENGLSQGSHDFGLRCSLEFSVRLKKSPHVLSQLEQIPGLTIGILPTDQVDLS